MVANSLCVSANWDNPSAMKPPRTIMRRIKKYHRSSRPFSLQIVSEVKIVENVPDQFRHICILVEFAQSLNQDCSAWMTWRLKNETQKLQRANHKVKDVHALLQRYGGHLTNDTHTTVEARKGPPGMNHNPTATASRPAFTHLPTPCCAVITFFNGDLRFRIHHFVGSWSPENAFCNTQVAEAPCTTFNCLVPALLQSGTGEPRHDVPCTPSQYVWL